MIHSTAQLGSDLKLGHNVVIMENVQIGECVSLGHNVVIHAGTIIGDGVDIQDNAVIGRQPKSGASSTRRVKKNLPGLEIGTEVVIGTGVILYAGTKIGRRAMIADLASIREGCVIGESAIIGRATTVELQTTVGARSIIQTACHLTGNMIIEEDVFFGAEVTCTNDLYMGRTEVVYKGPHVRKGARVGSNSTLMPGVIIGIDAVVGAGAVVTRDVPDFMIVMGVPARVVKEVPVERRRF